LDEVNFDDEVMQVIKEDTALELPTGARGLHFRYHPPIDPSWIAVIEIPPAATTHLIEQIASIENQSFEVSGGIEEKVDWWPPSSDAKVLIERQHIQASGAYLRVLVTDEGGKTLLYLKHIVV
jgi:hypothetical protein